MSKKNWFIKRFGIYWLRSWQGLLITLAWLAALILSINILAKPLFYFFIILANYSFYEQAEAVAVFSAFFIAAQWFAKLFSQAKQKDVFLTIFSLIFLGLMLISAVPFCSKLNTDYAKLRANKEAPLNQTFVNSFKQFQLPTTIYSWQTKYGRIYFVSYPLEMGGSTHYYDYQGKHLADCSYISGFIRPNAYDYACIFLGGLSAKHADYTYKQGMNGPILLK